MANANTESYEEMCSALSQYCSVVSECCGTMSQAGNDCVDNTDEDPAAVSSNSKLQSCVGNIQSALEDIEAIISALQEEIQKIEEAANRANG